MHHTLKAFDIRDIAKNSINAALAVSAYKQTKEQILLRTEHTPDDLTVRVGATVAGSTASMATRKYTDTMVDKIADWLVSRQTAKPDPKPTEVPTTS